MKRLNLTYKKVYFIYLIILVIASLSIIMYVNGLLHDYEDMRPEKLVEESISKLAKDATNDDFFKQYGLSEVKAERFEEKIDVKKEYLELFASDNLSFSAVNEKSDEDSLHYVIQNSGRTIADVKLKAMGPSVTKLAVLNFREWEIEEITPVFEKVDYTILLPVDFSISVNGIALTKEDGEVSDKKGITYTIPKVYLEPNFEIKDHEGNKVVYTVNNNKVLAQFYDYSLTLPKTLTVHVNDKVITGDREENNRVYYNIRTLEKPEVVLSDYYGNKISYDGKNEIPLTYMNVVADSRYLVKVDGEDIAKEAVNVSANKEYDQLKDYVKDLPQISEFDIAILKNDAKISISDEKGNPVDFEAGKESYDFTDTDSVNSDIPKEISSEIDILKIAQDWSLFMTNDKKFAAIQKYLIKDSYQYKVALQYATGVDITFTSRHTLANPAFTKSSVTNFKWIADNCFSVDVYFIKHMILTGYGTRVDDTMNNRIYFVKYDDTEDGKDNPTWKIVSMRETLKNGN